MLCESCFFVYICNVRRAGGWKREVRVHILSRPCAHGRLSFFRHSTIDCADARQRVCTRAGENVNVNGWMYIYTLRLYIYAKLTARESRICTQLFFRTKIRRNFEWSVSCWTSDGSWMWFILGLRSVHPWDEEGREMTFFDFLTKEKQKSWQKRVSGFKPILFLDADDADDTDKLFFLSP